MSDDASIFSRRVYACFLIIQRGHESVLLLGVEGSEGSLEH